MAERVLTQRELNRALPARQNGANDGGRIRLEPFGSLTRTARRDLREEAEQLAAFHA